MPIKLQNGILINEYIIFVKYVKKYGIFDVRDKNVRIREVSNQYARKD